MSYLLWLVCSGWYVVTHTVVSLWYHLNVLIPSESINYFCCIGCRVIQIRQNPVFNGLPLQLCFQTIVHYQKLLVLWCLEHFASGWKNVLKHSWSMSKSACAWHTKLGAGTNAELHSMHDDTETIECKSVSVDKQITTHAHYKFIACFVDCQMCC